MAEVQRRKEEEAERKEEMRKAWPSWISKVYGWWYMGVSKNKGTPKSSILIGFFIINHPFWGIPIFGNTHIVCIPVPTSN